MLSTVEEAVDKLFNRYEKEIVECLINEGFLIEGQFYFSGNTLR